MSGLLTPDIKEEILGSAEVLEIFKDLNKRGQTIVVITHEREIAEQSQRIITIKDGEIGSDSIN